MRNQNTKTKAIQLRGISRTPSDRMTNDGGCAESLNVYVDQQENCPSVAPEDIRSSIGITETDAANVVFIHKGNGYANYILEENGYMYAFFKQTIPTGWTTRDDVLLNGVSMRYDGVLIANLHPSQSSAVINENDLLSWKQRYYRVLGLVSSTSYRVVETDLRRNPMGIFDLNGATLLSVKSIGNTLILSLSTGVNYLKFKDGIYVDLGTKIPFPEVKFTYKEVEGERVVSLDRSFVSKYETLVNEAWDKDEDVDKEMSDITPSERTDREQAGELMEDLWECIEDNYIKNRDEYSAYNHQLFAIFALHLYDDSIICSTPILLSPGFEQPYEITLETGSVTYSYEMNDGENIPEDSPTGTEESNSAKIKVKTNYQPYIKMLSSASLLEDWRDVVESMQVYFSPRVATSLSSGNNRKRMKLTSTQTTRTETEDVFKMESGESEYEVKIGTCTKQFTVKQSVVTLGSKKYDYEEEYLNAVDFRLVQEWKIAEKSFVELNAGNFIDCRSCLNEAILRTNEALFSDVNSVSFQNYDIRYKNSLVYNNAILASGITQKLEFPNGDITSVAYIPSSGDYLKPTVTENDTYTLSIVYFLKGTTGDNYNICSDELTYGETMLIDNSSVRSNAFSFILAPDLRVYKALVTLTKRNGASSKKEILFKEHPLLEMAYWYAGMDNDIVKSLNLLQTSTLVYSNNNIEEVSNKIYMSRTEYPFVFPTATRYTFSGDVIGMAVATKALSEGQHGEFPLYVFTSEGIWSIQMQNGTFVTTVPGPRDVCINPDSITPVESAVVFVTSKGVMIIEGNEVNNLSTNMNGRHWALKEPSSEATIISQQNNWKEYLACLEDTTPFIEFAKNAKIAYDYTGNRLILFSNDNTIKYQYVYMFESQTWHKVQMPNASKLTFKNLLNSYPDCYMTAVDNQNKGYIYNLSMPLDVTDKDDVTAIIVTRSMDLDESDVHKTIKDVRVRGNHQRVDEDGKKRYPYMLLGSMDGINFYRIKSLEGKSWKFFRVILLAKMNPTDRITDLEIEYESRFTNKMR